MLQEVMSYLTYDEIAKCRAVSKKFDRNGRQMLNRGYQLISSQVTKYRREIFSKLTRQISERIKHPLHSLSLSVFTIENCLNIVESRYHLYKGTGVCCFIAGKVIDEAIKAFHNVTSTENRTRFILSKNLDKYVDMAADHFQDVVEPSLQNMIGNKLADDMDDCEKSSSEISENGTSRSDSLKELIEQELRKHVDSRIAKNRVAMLHMKKQIRKLRLKMSENKPSRMRFQILKLQQQNRRKDKQLKILKKRLRLVSRNNVRTEK